MKHPRKSEWTDYVRAVADDGDRTAMQKHVEDGCRVCSSLVATLERLVTTAEIDGAIAPPAGALRSVKAFFTVQSGGAAGRWTELVLRRAFDSNLAPAADSRASSHDVRQLLFESDEYTLELSLDQTPGEVDAVLRGQLLEARGEPRSHTPVFLVGGGQVIGRAISQQHGTFEMAGRLDQPCELWVFPDDRNRIRLRLEPDN